MGTRYHITLVSTQAKLNTHPNLHLEIDELLEQINQSLSTYQADSEVSLFNTNTSIDWLSVSADFYHLIKAAKLISERSQGAFDITVSPLVNLWGFGSKIQNETPSPKEIKQVLSNIGFKKLHINKENQTIKKQVPLLKIDLSSIAKGYAVDKISELLLQKNFKNHLVEIGGEIKVRGKNKLGNNWHIAIAHPAAKSSTRNSLKISDVAIATSGDYRNYYIKNKQRFSHIIDPTTGYPINHKLASVTVVHQSAMFADAWATALMLLGDVKAKELVVEKNLSVHMIIRGDNNNFSTWTNTLP